MQRALDVRLPERGLQLSRFIRQLGPATLEFVKASCQLDLLALILSNVMPQQCG